MTAVTKGSHRIAVALEGPGGAIAAEVQQDLAAGRRIVMALPALEPGTYVLRAAIHNARGKQCSQWAQPITLHAGPLY